MARHDLPDLRVGQHFADLALREPDPEDLLDLGDHAQVVQ
jgi:hypothetical protein